MKHHQCPNQLIKINAIIPCLILLFSITPLFTHQNRSLVFGSSVSERIAKRPDPLKKFKHYGGNYDIRNKHYWASAAFTGIHGYAVAALWLLCGVGFGVFIAVKNLIRTSSVVDHSNSSNLLMFLLIVVFTIFAISGSSVVIAANEKSLERSEKLEETIFGAGVNASLTLGRVKATLIQMHTLLLPYDSKTCELLDLITHRLRKVSSSVNAFVQSSRKSWDRAIQTLHVVNVVVVSINLALLVAGLVLLALQHRPCILALILCCWILTTLSWILTGVDFFFYNFIGDTCSTLKNFEEDPQNNRLKDMLPCPNFAASAQTLEQINYSVHTFIAEINSKIQEVLTEITDQSEDIPFPEVCDPFSTAPDYTYKPQNCRNNSIPVGDLPSILSRFICYEANDTSTENCMEDGRFVPEVIYEMSLAYSRSIQDFISIYPDLSSLMKCSSVKRAFSDIVAGQCKPIELWSKVLWSSILAVSIVMVILVLLWSCKAIQDRGRVFRCRWSIFSRSNQGS